MVYQNTNFKICLSLFGCEVNILPNVHIVQCHVEAVVSFDKNRFRAFSSWEALLDLEIFLPTIVIAATANTEIQNYKRTLFISQSPQPSSVSIYVKRGTKTKMDSSLKSIVGRRARRCLGCLELSRLSTVSQNRHHQRIHHHNHLCHLYIKWLNMWNEANYDWDGDGDVIEKQIWQGCAGRPFFLRGGAGQG